MKVGGICTAGGLNLSTGLILLNVTGKRQKGP